MILPIIIFSLNIDPLVKYLFYIGISGGLGGTVYLIRSFYKHIFEKNFRDDVFWWYLFRPFLSIIIGIFSYFLLIGGFLSIGDISNINYSKGIMFFCGISFLAGFSFTQFTNKLEEISETIFSKKGSDKK